MKTLSVRLLPLLAAVATSVGLLLAVLWQRSPVLAVALVGPLFAIVLYYRSASRGRAAMRLALTDPLTGLGNQRAFREHLERELARAGADGVPLALCLLDVDDFKRVNDRSGHAGGDHVLIEVAGCLRRNGEAFRLGGDEFALVLGGAGAGEGSRVAEAVVARVATPRVGTIGGVTVSAGLATLPEDGSTIAELMAEADARLYRAKTAGGNRVAIGVEPLAAAGLDA